MKVKKCPKKKKLIKKNNETSTHARNVYFYKEKKAFTYPNTYQIIKKKGLASKI